MVWENAIPSQANSAGVDRPDTVLSVVAGSAVAILALLLGPLLIGEYVNTFGVSDSDAGWIFSVEMLAFTSASVTLFVILGKNWRRITTVALLMMVLGNTLCLVADGLVGFVSARFIAGFGAGLVMAMTIQVIGLMSDPDRVYGLWTVGQLALGALGILAFPQIISMGGTNAVFLIWAMFAALLLFSTRYYPKARDAVLHSKHRERSSWHFVLGICCLIGLFIYYCGQTGVWVYLERLGAQWNLGVEAVANILFVSLLAGIAGATVAVIVGNKFGRTFPIVMSLLMSAVSITMLIITAGEPAFLIAVCLFNFAWYLFLPYSSAVIAVADNDGKLLSGLAVVFPASLATGPAVAALLLRNADSLFPVLIFGLLSVPIGMVLMIPASRIKAF
jgi:predicted MFS family arabinose efflux permease